MAGLIWSEIRSLWTDGLMEYTADLWNIVDFITNMFYLMWLSLRITSWYIVNIVSITYNTSTSVCVSEALIIQDNKRQLIVLQ